MPVQNTSVSPAQHTNNDHHDNQIWKSPPGLGKTGAAPGHHIVIPGTGHSGTAVLQSLLNIFKGNPSILAGVPLYLVISGEKSRYPGVAYTAENKNNILNAPASSMTYRNQKNPFHSWISNHEKQLVKAGLIEKNADGYSKSHMPRSLYGKYIEAGRQSMLSGLSNRFFIQNKKNDPATAVWSEGEKTHMTFQSGEEQSFDASFFAIGGFAPSFGEKIAAHPLVQDGSVQYCKTPFHPDTLKQFAPETPVTIFGSQLSGIEAGMALNLGEKGHVTFVSRSGSIPPLVPLEKNLFTPKFFTMEKLVELKNNNELTADNLQKLVQQEAEFHCLEPQYGFSETFNLQDYKTPFKPGQHASPAEFTQGLADSLAHDVQATRDGKMTHNTFGWIVMNSIYDTADAMFKREMLPPEEHRAAAAILSWPAALPLQTGEKLLEKMQNKQVSFFPGVQEHFEALAGENKLNWKAEYGADGQTFEHATNQIIDATGGYNTTMYNLESSSNPLQQSALHNGVFTPYTRTTSKGDKVNMGGLDYQAGTNRLVSTAKNAFGVGALMYGKSLPPPSGTAGHLTTSAENAVKSWVESAEKTVNTPALAAQLKREELIDLSNKQLKKLEALLPKSSDLAIQGELDPNTARLLFPAQKVFSLSDAKQFAVFIGMSRPEAGQEISARDDFIVQQLQPGKKETPLCYFSELVTDKQNNSFWLNIVLWNKQVMEPTRFQLEKRENWTPPAKAKHSDTVDFALTGKPSGALPAFKEVHFMNGKVNADKARFDVEEYRQTITHTPTTPGEKTVFRLNKPAGDSGSTGQRWTVVARQAWKPIQ